MSARFQLLAQQILGTDLTESSEEKLHALVEQYPYFSPAYILLAKKQQQQPIEGAENPVQKALLFHHNPLAFNYSFCNDDTSAPFEWETEAPLRTKYDFSSFENNLPSQAEEDYVVEEEAYLNNDLENEEDSESIENEEEEGWLPPLPAELINLETKQSGAGIVDEQNDETETFS